MYFHKNIRLSSTNYKGRQCYFVTLCCAARRRIFSSPTACRWLIEILRTESEARAFAIHAYCAMPDHFHFLAEGLLPTSDLTNFVLTLKLKATRPYFRKKARALWQKKFFDHILRPSERLEPVAYYIWMNPVRKGLSRSVGEYPFAGSFTQMSAHIESSNSVWTRPWESKAPASEGGRYKP